MQHRGKAQRVGILLRTTFSGTEFEQWIFLYISCYINTWDEIVELVHSKLQSINLIAGVFEYNKQMLQTKPYFGSMPNKGKLLQCVFPGGLKYLYKSRDKTNKRCANDFSNGQMPHFLLSKIISIETNFVKCKFCAYFQS